MIKEYNKKFNKEIDRILSEIYNNPLKPNGKDKRAIIKTSRNYIQFLEEHELVQLLQVQSAEDSYSLILEKNGYEVFEKYGSWKKYNKKVVIPKVRAENHKILKLRYWWLPILISLSALVISILAYLRK